MTSKTIYLPDTGGANALDVIELLVKVGDSVTQDQALLTLESDKATLDVPAPFTGVITAIKVKLGDKIKTGDSIAEIETNEANMEASVAPTDAPPTVDEKPAAAQSVPTASPSAAVLFTLPDTGSSSAVSVIEISVSAGDMIVEGQTLCILESDKATMDVPAPFAGRVQQLRLKVGDKINSGAEVALLIPTNAPIANTPVPAPTIPVNPTTATSTAMMKSIAPSDNASYAGPSVRRLARLLGVNLQQIKATGDKGRITQDDIRAHVKALVAQAQNASPSTMGLPTMPAIDFSQYGAIESQPLSRIKKLTAQNLSRNWLLAPHVTQFEEADITEMEAFRKSQAPLYAKRNIKLTPLVFIMKAIVGALQQAPTFNASLDASGENLILKKYFHIGIAVDTPDGLVVPVIHDVDQKSLSQLAEELAEVGEKARAKKLTAADMQGSCFTISSLGGIGGTAFTPIINLPNVAILGVSKAAIKPQWDGQQFLPRLMLPLSLSYDHRVIDGAEAARFIVTIARYLADIRLLLL